MKIEITEQIEKAILIEVDLPYYYEHDLMSHYGDNIIYGKIEETKHTCIQEITNDNGAHSFKIEKEKHNSIKNSGLVPYFKKEHRSSEEDYQNAKNRALNFSNSC